MSAARTASNFRAWSSIIRLKPKFRNCCEQCGFIKLFGTGIFIMSSKLNGGLQITLATFRFEISPTQRSTLKKSLAWQQGALTFVDSLQLDFVQCNILYNALHNNDRERGVFFTVLSPRSRSLSLIGFPVRFYEVGVIFGRQGRLSCN